MLKRTKIEYTEQKKLLVLLIVLQIFRSPLKGVVLLWPAHKLTKQKSFKINRLFIAHLLITS